MRAEALELLRCPECHAQPFNLRIDTESEEEIREGELACSGCGKSFSIRRGVVEMLSNPSHQASDEIESIDSWLPQVEQVTPLNDEWLVGLPQTFHKGEDTDIAVNLPKLLDLVDPKPRQTVLEVGAGVTWLSNLLAQRGSRVMATDITRRMYVGLDSADVLMQHSGASYERVLAEMDDIPCGDDSFDVVVANAVLHHSEDLVASFSEIRRVLRPGGTVVLIEPVVGPLNMAGKAFMAGLHDDGLGDQAYPVWAYTRAAQEAGLTCEISIAPSVDHHLRHLRSDPDYAGNRTLKYRLARSMTGVFQLPLLGRLARSALYAACLRLFGLTCIIVGQRPSGATPS